MKTRVIQVARKECSAGSSRGFQIQRACVAAFLVVLTYSWLVVVLQPLLSYLQNCSAPPLVTASAEQEQGKSVEVLWL